VTGALLWEVAGVPALHDPHLHHARTATWGDHVTDAEYGERTWSRRCRIMSDGTAPAKRRLF
jgi:hypothetical protein